MVERTPPSGCAERLLKAPDARVRAIVEQKKTVEDYKNKDEIKKVTMEKLAENGFKCKDEEIITDIFHIRIRDKEIEIKRFL